MKKSFVLTVVGFVLFAIGVAIIAIAEKNSIVLPVWATVVSCGLTIAAGVLAVCSNYVDKQVPNRKSLMVIFTMFPIMAVMYALRYADVVSDEVAGYTLIAVLIIGSFLAFHFDENYRLKKKAEPADNADADETKPLPDVDYDDVTVIGDKEGDAVVVEVNPDNGVEVQVPEEYETLLDRVASLDENGNIRLSKDGYGDVVITPEGVVTGEVPESLYIPDLDNQEGWKNVYQGVRERLEERPDENK